jgi:hypothetical protein
MVELNDARCKHGPDSHHKLKFLETALKQLVSFPPTFYFVADD